MSIRRFCAMQLLPAWSGSAPVAHSTGEDSGQDFFLLGSREDLASSYQRMEFGERIPALPECATTDFSMILRQASAHIVRID